MPFRVRKTKLTMGVGWEWVSGGGKVGGGDGEGLHQGAGPLGRNRSYLTEGKLFLISV